MWRKPCLNDTYEPGSTFNIITMAAGLEAGPLNSDIWYFIAWDNDGCLMRPEYELRNFSDQNSWEKGISNYWGNILFQRCLKSRSFREKLNDAILDLREYLNKDMLTFLTAGILYCLDPGDG